MLQKIAASILRARGKTLAFFAVALAVSVWASGLVTVNFKLTDYLPEQTHSTVGLRLMEAEFASKPSNLRVLLYDVSVPPAQRLKDRIAGVPGVKDVSWLGDAVDVKTPLEMAPKKTVDAWYKGGNALITAYLPDASADAALTQIRQIIGPDNAMDGDSVQMKETRARVKEDILKIMVLAVPIIFVILLFVTTSALEPLLFLATIGVAILLGKGTDALFGSVSFITSACTAILQLAISMDYAIFLLEAFEENRRAGQPAFEAMTNAMTRAFSAILSSALTTVMGFLVMVLMEFKVGSDLGLVLAKDITLSLICVLVLLPCLTMVFYKWLEKTEHRPFLPSFRRTGRAVARISIPLTVVLALLAVLPGYLASQKTDFFYGTGRLITDPDNPVVREQADVEALYEKSNQMVLIVPGGDMAREQALSHDLLKIDEISSVLCYASMADTTIPVEFVGGAADELIGPRYDRMILSAPIETESERAFRLVEDIRAAASKYYGQDAYLTGGTANIYDMREVVRRDDALVNRLALLSIGLVLLFTFKSLILPVLLLLVIKSSIYVNVSIPYFAGAGMFYIASLIINAIQLGATVDYAILFTTRYMACRKTLRARAASARTVTESLPSILTSAAIMLTGGLTLGLLSSVSVVGELGVLVGRGAAISALLVLTGLPALLTLFDPLIRLTTLNAGFYRDKKGTHAVSERTIVDETNLSYEDFLSLYGDDDLDGGRACVDETGDRLRESRRGRADSPNLRGEPL